MRRIERKRNGRTAGRVELIFIEHLERAGGDDRAVRNAVLLQIIRRVADVPTTNVHVAAARIVKLNGVLQRRVGVAEHFVDDDI